jgi:hypothetical protein
MGKAFQDVGLLTSPNPSSNQLPKEGRMGTLKGVPWPARSKTLSQSTNRKTTNYGKNRRNNSLAGQPSLSLAPEISTWLHSSVLYNKSCFLTNVGSLRSTLPSATWPDASHPEIPEKPAPLHKKDPGLPLLPVSQGTNQQVLFSCACCTTVWGSWMLAPGKQAPELSLHTILFSHAFNSCCSQWKSPHSSIKAQGHQIPHGAEDNCILLLCGEHQKACFPKVHRGPALPTVPAYRNVPSLLSKSWNPSFSKSGIPLLCGHQEAFLLQRTKVQHSQLWLQESPQSPIKEKEHQLHHWGGKR